MKMFKSFSIIAISLFFIIACSANTSENENNNVTENDEIEPIVELLPDELGQKIGDNYIEMFSELNNLLEKKLEVEELKPQLADLKEKYIIIFVKFGSQREKFSETEKTKVNTAIRSIFRTMDSELMDRFNESINYYREIDNDLANEIVTFNILTQYADYELLIKQEPEEAKRLGIIE